MPTFDFKCKCGNIFEELVLQGEKVSCPKCGDKTLKKLMGTPRVIFKGSGWATYDGRVTKDIQNMIKTHKNKSYLKSNDGHNTVNDKYDIEKIKSIG
tara:strand:+ start:345 stop:635 length:291 start_codon:yes stop_codon:yes gene_type:complete